MRGCQAGTIERFGRWTAAGGTVRLEEQFRVVREVTDTKRHAKYRSCKGTWDGDACIKTEFQNTVECSLAGTTDRIVDTRGASDGPVVSTGPCVVGKTLNERGTYAKAEADAYRDTRHTCVAFAGRAHWAFGAERDIPDYIPGPSDFVFDASAGRWERGAPKE